MEFVELMVMILNVIVQRIGEEKIVAVEARIEKVIFKRYGHSLKAKKNYNTLFESIESFLFQPVRFRISHLCCS